MLDDDDVAFSSWYELYPGCPIVSYTRVSAFGFNAPPWWSTVVLPRNDHA
jgi:hypothetical protein